MAEQIIPLPDGRLLHATFDDGTARWVVWLGDDVHRSEVGSDLALALYDLFDITDDEPSWIQ